MATPTNPMWAHLAALSANPFIPELHEDDCQDVACVRCTDEQPNPIAETARRKRRARAERVERKRVEHLRAHMPLDDPDRHDIDLIDRAFAHLAHGWNGSQA